MASQGLLLYGGITWPDVDMVVSDQNRAKLKDYEELCLKKVERMVELEQRFNKNLPMLGLKDIGTRWWKYMWSRTRHECFNYVKYPPFPTNTRVISYNKDVYLLPLDNCWEGCNDNGGCTTGRCTCKNGYYGEACEFKNCPNSLIFVDIDNINLQLRHHCSLHGECVDSVCECKDEYYGPDCGNTGCKNNCSNTETETYGICVENYPMNYCLCDKFKMRGGDDCSIIYCLNQCSGHGACVEGTCECDEDFYGVDCSVLVKSAISSAITLLFSNSAATTVILVFLVSNLIL